MEVSEHCGTLDRCQAYHGPLTGGREIPGGKSGKAVVGAAGAAANGSAGGCVYGREKRVIDNRRNRVDKTGTAGGKSRTK